MQRGNISVSTENIFPIIKQSLYSEQEIFLRELVSNAVDATQKLKFLSGRGEADVELGDITIEVKIDKEAKTLTISDKGIGMTEEEVMKYLNQVAFSGAEEFLKKFQEAAQGDEIIGRFGLGFYSAFMVADTVEVITKSYQDAAAVRWTCDGSTAYELDTAEKEDRGTDIILHIAEDAVEYLEDARIQAILDKYCKFLPVEIKFGEEVINNPNPLWKKSPTELKDEEYLELFKELYPHEQEPLFWIHLNVDYPFTLNGVLYFPKIRPDLDPKKNNIQLYSRQVFITDEVSNIVPEFLMLLQGVIDSPDIPLNVSRSYLQGDPNVKKISSYITRKVADKLNEIYRDDRASFEDKWQDISTFVKYGMVTNEKFDEKAVDFTLVTNVDGNHFTLDEYKEKVAANQTDVNDSLVVLYAQDKKAQDMYITAAQDRDYDVLMMDGVLDNHFVQHLERKIEKSRWVRVDSDTLDKIIPKTKPEEGEEEKATGSVSEEQQTSLKELFDMAKPGPEMTVQLEELGDKDLPVLITRPEFMRRMKDMAAMGGGGAFGMEMPDAVNLVINTGHPSVQALTAEGDHEAMAKQLVDLALLSQNMLEGKALTEFVKRSVELLG